MAETITIFYTSLLVTHSDYILRYQSPLQNLPSFPRRRESTGGKSNLADWEAGHIILVPRSFAKVSVPGYEVFNGEELTWL